MARRVLVGLGLVLALGLSGCGRAKGPVTAVVTGKVTLNGESLADGSINFLPADGNGVTSGAKIVNGTYRADVPPGPKRVEIRSTKVVGQKVAYEGDPNSPKYDIVEERIPDKYNANSELKASVNAGSNKADFPLEAPKKE